MSMSGNGANLGLEEKLWAATDKMLGQMHAVQFKRVVLGLVFLQELSDAFHKHQGALR
jgi:type I restriction enzyme M protein